MPRVSAPAWQLTLGLAEHSGIFLGVNAPESPSPVLFPPYLCCPQVTKGGCCSWLMVITRSAEVRRGEQLVPHRRQPRGQHMRHAGRARAGQPIRAGHAARLQHHLFHRASEKRKLAVRELPPLEDDRTSEGLFLVWLEPGGLLPGRMRKRLLTAKPAVPRRRPAVRLDQQARAARALPDVDSRASGPPVAVLPEHGVQDPQGRCGG